LESVVTYSYHIWHFLEKMMCPEGAVIPNCGLSEFWNGLQG